MISQEAILKFVDLLVVFASHNLLPFMIMLFFAAIVTRFLVQLTVKRQEWFVKEFSKRTHAYLDATSKDEQINFYMALKVTLEKTFYELFIKRAIMARRKPDVVMSLADRVFLIQEGSAWIVKDSLKQMKYLKKDNGSQTKFLEISKNVLQNNPCFNRIMGVIPAGTINDILNILPGIFIVGGIFGTFLGIMKALPELGNMNLSDPESTKIVMDQFLLKISFSMSTSIIGIIISVAMSFFNTLFSPEKVFLDSVERLENTLDILWNCSHTGPIPNDFEQFDEHQDPVFALAESALSREINKSRHSKFIAKEQADSRARQEHAIYIHKKENGIDSPPAQAEGLKEKGHDKEEAS